jgi:hypothetical protein
MRRVVDRLFLLFLVFLRQTARSNYANYGEDGKQNEEFRPCHLLSPNEFTLNDVQDADNKCKRQDGKHVPDSAFAFHSIPILFHFDSYQVNVRLHFRRG